MMIALDAGAEDIQEEEDSFVILTAPEDFPAVNQAIQDAGIASVSAEVTKLPQNYVDVTDPAALKGLRIILGKLDESDDVQNVYHNWTGDDED